MGYWDLKSVPMFAHASYKLFAFHTLSNTPNSAPMQADPRNVMLVHGEAAKMEFLKQKIMQEFGINCFTPANGEAVTVATPPSFPWTCLKCYSRELLSSAMVGPLSP